MSKQTPIYATLLYEVLKELEVSISEYFYLDMVHKLSYQRWCIKSLDNCAEDMRISKRGLIKLRDRLITRGLLEKNAQGHLRVTAQYTEVAVNKVHHSSTQPVNLVPKSVNLVPKSVNLVHRIGELSSPKNNNRVTKEYKEGYKLAKIAAEQIRSRTGSQPAPQRLSSLFK